MDDKIKIKQETLIEMVTAFGGEYLDDEFTELCVKLIEKMGRKREVPFKRGKLENWASGVVYTIGQLNFLFDDSFKPYASADDICNYFGTKKSTSSNKARDIRNLLHLNLGNKEFSTKRVLNLDLSNIGRDLTQIKTLEGASRQSTLRGLGNTLRTVAGYDYSLDEVENDDLLNIIREILNSDEEFIDESEIDDLAFHLCNATLISPACGAGLLMLGDNDNRVVPAFTSMNEYNLEFTGGNIGPVCWDFIEILRYLEDDDVIGMAINPHIDNFFASRGIIYRALEKHPFLKNKI